jgi:hypothetical protein
MDFIHPSTLMCIRILVEALKLKDASKHNLHWKMYKHAFRKALYVFINILMTVMYRTIPVARFKVLHTLPLFIPLCFQYHLSALGYVNNKPDCG